MYSKRYIKLCIYMSLYKPMCYINMCYSKVVYTKLFNTNKCLHNIMFILIKLYIRHRAPEARTGLIQCPCLKSEVWYPACKALSSSSLRDDPMVGTRPPAKVFVAPQIGNYQ